MSIVIAGGSGQVGTLLARAFVDDGRDVVVLSRTRSDQPHPWRVVPWDARTLGAWTDEIDGSDAVINLAGRSVNCRYTAENRRLILNSRVDSTHVIGEAIARSTRPPRTWLQMSTATIYAHRFDAPNDETFGIIGGAERDAPDTWRFSIEVATAWERALHDARVADTRIVALRSAMVMSPDRDGIFDTLLGLVRHGLGGTSGSGRQFISWIHDADFVRAVRWLLDHEEMSGAVNVSSPNPLPNAEFMRTLRTAWGTRIGLPAMEWMLELGALAMGTESELVLKSRRVVPGRLLESGFAFEFSHWDAAARDLCARWRGLSNGAAKTLSS